MPMKKKRLSALISMNPSLSGDLPMHISAERVLLHPAIDSALLLQAIHDRRLPAISENLLDKISGHSENEPARGVPTGRPGALSF
jgi:hypothetical protein